MIQGRNDGAQQSQRDIPESMINAIQERLEEIADNEVYTAHPRFAEWLCDQDGDDIAAIIASAMKCRWRTPDGEDARQSLALYLERLVMDYRYHRVDLGSAEAAAIEAELSEDYDEA